LKRAIFCLGCGKIKRLSKSYQVKIEGFVKEPLTGNFKELKNIQTRICRDCAKEAGYVVKRTKIEKNDRPNK